jgi:saccharopine dehydrogenase-like NADP-dependent oxidoreductase
MRILILGGAGLMAAGTARDLLSSMSSNVEQVIATDVNSDRLSALKQSLPDPRLQTRILDVSDRAALLALLAGCDLCINGVPTFTGFQMEIFDACLEARRAYVDYGGMGVFTVRQKAQHARWKSAGATAVIGLGSDPGLSNILCRAVADRLDRIDAINLYWASTKVGPESPVLVPPYNLATILAEYANPSQQFLDGRLQEVPAQAGIETLELPDPWGHTVFMHSQHSEPLTVPFADGIADKGIREFTWKMSLPRRDHEAWIGLVKAGFGPADDPVMVNGISVHPIDVLQAVMSRNITRNQASIPVQDNYEIHFAIGRGMRQRKRCRVTCRVIARPHPLHQQYLDASTSMSMSVGVQQMLGRRLRPGVWAPEEYFDPESFFSELRKRCFSIEVETETIQNDQ